MIVAVVAVRMVQVVGDQIVGMVAVWDRFVAAAGAMFVFRVVAAAGVIRRAGRGVRAVDRQNMLLDAVGREMMHVAVVKIVRVAVVFERRVATARTVLVSVVGVCLAHAIPLSNLNPSIRPLTFSVRCELLGMGESGPNQVRDVSVGQRVENVRTFAPPRHQPFVPKQP